jgi:hypothetical protein
MRNFLATLFIGVLGPNSAFHAAMKDIGAGSKGDAVKGRMLYGAMPELALGDPEDEGDEPAGVALLCARMEVSFG